MTRTSTVKMLTINEAARLVPGLTKYRIREMCVQMAFAYVGTCLMPPLFGLIANHITVALLPVYLFTLTVLMFFMHERLLRKV